MQFGELKMAKLSISVVIPAYNEEKRIGKTLRKILKYFENKKYDYEIIVVDDCSKDKTVHVAEFFKSKRIKIIKNLCNLGKGGAVRKGMLSAKKKYVLFSDADLSTPIEQIEKFLPFIKKYDVIIGSRALNDSEIRIKQPFYRVIMGRIFNLIVQILLLKGIKDTQCGFKLFTRKSAKKIFPKQTFKGFSFDVEILYIARKTGYKIKEVPVVWINSPESKVSALKDSIKMFIDLIKIRINSIKGKY